MSSAAPSRRWLGATGDLLGRPFGCRSMCGIAANLDPKTVFTEFAFRIDTPPPAISNTCFADYPTLGIDAHALYIGTSNFCGSPLTYNSADGFVVRKSSVLGAGPIVVTALRGLVPDASSDGPYVPQGVDNYDPSSNEGYFIGVSNTLFGRLVLRRVATPGGTPTVSANIGITVPATAFPLLVPHLGNTGGAAGNLSAVDDRLFAAHLRNGRLWTAHALVRALRCREPLGADDRRVGHRVHAFGRQHHRSAALLVPERHGVGPGTRPDGDEHRRRQQLYRRRDHRKARGRRARRHGHARPLHGQHQRLQSPG